MNYKTCWLTLNRACNLRCKWCYARDTGFLNSDNMNLDMVYQIVDICADLKIKHITIIGGEPTIYPYFNDVVKYIIKKGLTCGVVTNGVALADCKLLDKMIESGQKSFSISLKGENEKSFEQTTGTDYWKKVFQGIQNCISRGCRISISMVLTEGNMETFVEGIKKCYDMGVRNFRFSFCYDFDSSDKNDYIAKHNPYLLIEKFKKIYPILNDVTHGNFKLFQSFPLCIWDESFIKLLVKRKQITSICQLLNKTGLIFDSNGYLIPCNSMHKSKLGQINKDFDDYKSLINYVNSKKIVNVYNKLCALPSEDCTRCSKLVNCGGGCVCQWTNYSYSEIMKGCQENGNKIA